MFNLFLWGMLGVGLTICVLFFYLVLKEKVLASKWMKKRRLKQIVKHKKFGKIKFVENQPAPGFEYPLPLTDVEAFVKKVRGELRTAVEGVETIRLQNRPDWVPISTSGAYHSYESHRSPIGATIDLYPMKVDGEFFRMYLFFKEHEEKLQVRSDIQDRPYVLLTKEQAKKEMLQTLGHELGHSLIYNLEKKLYGDEIEHRCNAWARQFGGESIPYEEFKKLIVYKEGKEIGPFEDVV